MSAQPPDRRVIERRLLLGRRSGLDRRVAERRLGGERRTHTDRRHRIDRRGAEETVAEHIRNALQFLLNVTESQQLGAELRKDLDAANLRLRLALAQLEAKP